MTTNTVKHTPPMTPTEKHRETAEKVVNDFRMIGDGCEGDLMEMIAAALANSEREGMKRAAEIAASYPPDGFFDLLKGATESSDPVCELHLFEGDNGNWAWLIGVLLQPYVSAILSEAGEG